MSWTLDIEVGHLTGRPLTLEQREALVAEALRLNMSYTREIVEDLNFCPYARSARHEERTTRYVILDLPDVDATEDATSTRVEPILDLWSEIMDDRQQEVIQVIFPVAVVEPLRWVRFANQICELARGRFDRPPAYAAAAFHPRMRFREDTPSGLIPLYRRTPDPTIQWVRHDVLAEIKKGDSKIDHYIPPEKLQDYIDGKIPIRKSVTERISEAGFKTAHHHGIQRLVEQLEQIYAERCASYARILGITLEP